MAVIYSKLGGCLGVTAKLGPLARTDLWAGVKGLLERLMTHLGLGSSLEDPWGGYWGVVVRLSSWEIVLFSWEAWGALCLEECLRPCLTDLAWLLNWPAWGELLPSPWEGWAVAWGVLLPSLGGRRAVAWGELLPLLEGRWAIAWEQLLPSPEGRWAVARGELRGTPDWMTAGVALLPSLGGRWVTAWGELLPSPERRWAVAGGELLPSPGGRWAIARGELRRTPDWLTVGVELIAWEGLLPSLEGRRAPAWLLVWGGLLLPWGRNTSLSDWLGT